MAGGSSPLDTPVSCATANPDPDAADRLVAVDGKPVRSVDDLLTEVEAHEPGEIVTITTVREGRKRDVKVELGATE